MSNEQNATPGAIPTGEDSVTHSAESSRPRELLTSKDEVGRLRQALDEVRTAKTVREAQRIAYKALIIPSPDETCDALDAARYRFLRQPGNAIVYAKDRNTWGEGASGHVSYKTAEQLDAAVDKARGELKANDPLAQLEDDATFGAIVEEIQAKRGGA